MPGAGRVEDLRGTLRHDSFTTMTDYLTKQVNLSRISAESLIARGTRGSYLRLVISPAAAFLKQIVGHAGGTAGAAGVQRTPPPSPPR